MNKSFDIQLHELAVAIAKKATLETTPFPECLDAFKALNAYYANLAKHRGKAGDEPDGSDPGGLSLSDLAAKLKVEVENGTPVRSHRRQHS